MLGGRQAQLRQQGLPKVCNTLILSEANRMQEVRADAQTISKVLGGAKFQVDYYQREYRWEDKQVTELLNDLGEAFLADYKPGQEPSAVEDYNHYFLGSIIISSSGGKRFIIDGQQRLTTLTLLLIHLYRELENAEDKAQVAYLIFSQKFQRQSFNLDVSEREDCMRAIFEGREPNVEGQSESIANIANRFRLIQDNLSLEETSSREDESRIDRKALPYFANWLMEKVFLVEIEASSDAEAYTIFETMNDRGLSLTPTEMLKGYLLANVTDAASRASANDIWKQCITALQDLGKEEDADAIKAWLRSQYATELRERSRNAAPRDFERIGTEFHRWVRDNKEQLGLQHSPHFALIIKDDFTYYTRWYQRIREAGEHPTHELEAIHYNARNNFTLQYTVLLAPLLKTDTDAVVYKKLSIVANYLDMLIARRIWNWRNFGYSTMSYSMFSLVRDIRHKDIEDLAQILFQRLENEDTFADNEWFHLHGTNGPKVHYLLARITDYVEMGSGMPYRFNEYTDRGRRDPYEIEHIWANHFDRHEDEYPHVADFRSGRNLFGGLLLLPKSFNASYGDMEYGEKREHYFGQNLLARSLHHRAYENNPNFLAFKDRTGLPFQAHTEFKKKDLEDRQQLYSLIAETLWNPDNLLREAEHL